MANALTISALERETGVPRSTIHFYVREGLLPQPQKTATSRALYTEDHLHLLRQIVKLKAAGLSLAQIRVALEKDLAEAQQNAIHIADQEYERVHKAILREATKQFLAKGYKRTHVAAIIHEVSITPQVFYAHFPSKLELLVESFRAFMSWNLAFVETDEMQERDWGERLLQRLLADVYAAEFGADVITHIRQEPERSRAEKLRLAEQAWEGVTTAIKRDFEAMLPAGVPSPVPLDLLAYSLIGAHHNASARASWDETFTRADVLRTHLWLWLAVTAALSGEIDLSTRMAHYEKLIQELATAQPSIPPALGDQPEESAE